MKILAMAGSTRRDSLNRRLLEHAVEVAHRAGAEVDVFDLREQPLPLYDGDLEADRGLPEAARDLRRRMVEADGFLIATPEHNSAYPAVLKNALDWASRGGPPAEAFAGKRAALMSASPGAFGGARALAALRTLLVNMQVSVLPEQVAVGRAHERLEHPDTHRAVEALVSDLVATRRAA